MTPSTKYACVHRQLNLSDFFHQCTAESPLLEQLFWNGKYNGLQYDIKLNSLIGKRLPESDLLMENFEDFAVYGKVIEVTSGCSAKKAR